MSAMQTQTVKDVMTPEPITLELTSTVHDAACVFKSADIGSIPVVDDTGRLCGIVTDRDLVVRAIAEGLDPKATPLSYIASQMLCAVTPDDLVSAAMEMMRSQSLRRLPVVSPNGKVIGIVSLGDLACERDPSSVLAGISAAPPNA